MASANLSLPRIAREDVVDGVLSAVFVVEPSRGKKVVEGFLGMFRSDFWISDRYGGQMGWA